MSMTATATSTTTTRAVPDALFRRVQAEFLEMPGLCLTEPQACRLWGLDRDTCSLVLSRLVDSKFLKRTRDGGVVQHTADLFVRL